MIIQTSSSMKRDDRGSGGVLQWSHEETRDFIWIRGELERDFTIAKRNKTLWEIVAKKMKERGFKRSPNQCKCKWKNLVNRYKGTEISDPENGRQSPFFNDIRAVFLERAKNMQRLLLESEAGGLQAKNKLRTLTADKSSDEFTDDDDDHGEDESEEDCLSKNSLKRKLNPPPKSTFSLKPSSSTSNSGSIEDLLREFLQQQQRMEIHWRETMERRAHERLLFELEWRESMEKLERERLVAEQAWREKEEQRRIKEEVRTEKRDALLTDLLSKLAQEHDI